jgi:signal transduction histidine kinase/DNA-binding response OmpR family regulator
MASEAGPHGLFSARLEVVAELASLINSTYDLEEIFRAAILKLGRVLEFRRASVVLLSEDRKTYFLHTLYDAARGGFVDEKGSYPVERGLTGQAIRNGQAIRVDAFVGTDGIRTGNEGNVSALIVPLSVDGEVIGTLNLGARESARYGEGDLELAVLLGRQIATSLHYSKLLATIEQQREALAVEHVKVESERTRLAALIDASDAAIMMVSDGRVAHANAGMAELLGLPREVVVGAPLEQVDRVLARSFVDAGALTVQTEALRRGGASLRDRVELCFPRRLICQRTLTTVRGADGELLGHLVLYRDVTREAEAEAAKSEFVSLVSHELRTPLTSVKTSLGLLARGAAGALSEGVRDLLAIALRNLDRLIRLVDDLLDLSRIESGRMAMKLGPVPLDETVARAIDAVAGFAEERRVRLERGESDAGLLVSADADRLQQVVINLLSNAIKFSPEGGRVALSWWRQGDQAVMEIADEGPGIPAAELERVFDKFRQLEQTATRKYGGAGLGLPISRKIVEQFGGDLWAESEEGRGSRFFVRLRLARAEAERAPASVAPSAPRRLLLVEPDPDLQRLLGAEFEAEGWEVRATRCGDVGLQLARAGGVGAIVVAVELQDMHGLEFLQRLRQAPACVDTPALLVGPGGDAAQAIAYGADGWLVGDADRVVAEAGRQIAAPRRRVVLLVEDDPAARMGLARGLRRAGYACLEAASGELALELARERAPDLVLADIQLPGKDGLAMLRELRADPTLADVPALIVAAHAGPEAVGAVRSLRAELVARPFATSTVLREIERLIGSPR